jgi:hypothetical protein
VINAGGVGPVRALIGFWEFHRLFGIGDTTARIAALK